MPQPRSTTLDAPVDAEPSGAMRGHRHARRLLERVVGEVHPGGVGAELRRRLAAQVVLRHGRCDERRGVRLAQPGAERQVRLDAGTLGDLVEQQLARRGQQLLERRQIHGESLPCASLIHVLSADLVTWTVRAFVITYDKMSRWKVTT